MSAPQTIAVAQLAELLRAGKAALIDVRTPAEFREMHVVGARNIPLDTFDPRQAAAAVGASEQQPIYVICRSGGRAGQACQKFLQAGYSQVFNVEGGSLAWDAAGLPMQRGKKTISLERQVRIAAGLLVLVGAILALAVHPYFAGICAFVGAGLTFAGVTDTCGMGMLLARMPWNQAGSASPTDASGSCQAA